MAALLLTPLPKKKKKKKKTFSIYSFVRLFVSDPMTSMKSYNALDRPDEYQ